MRPPVVCRSLHLAKADRQREGQNLKGRNSSVHSGFADRPNAGRLPVVLLRKGRQMVISVGRQVAVLGLKNEPIAGLAGSGHGEWKVHVSH